MSRHSALESLERCREGLNDIARLTTWLLEAHLEREADPQSERAHRHSRAALKYLSGEYDVLRLHMAIIRDHLT